MAWTGENLAFIL